MSLQSFNYLITGGAGFIGSHLAEYLHQAQCHVILVDNLSTGNMQNIQHLKKVPFFQVDINDTATIRSIIKKYSIDFIFHLAALGSVNRSIEKPMDTHLANSTGFLSVLEAARINEIKGVIFSSSSSVYGDNDTLPKMEHIIGNPLSPYAITKLTNEWYARLFYKLYQLPTIGLRYFNVFGPRQNPQGPYAAVIPIFINRMLQQQEIYIYGNGEQKRDFTYVDNVVSANILALNAIIQEKKDTFGEVFNVGCHQSISINEVFHILSKKLNYTLKPIYTNKRVGDIFQSLADITKIQKMLNYKPLTYFEEGIDKTISFYKKNNRLSS